MKITRVYIENFRSIKMLDFSPGGYCVLIGENNAGKSNILKAVNLVLGETWPTDRTFSDEDFNNQDTSKDLRIQVYFDETIEVWKNKCKCIVCGFELKCHAYKRKTGSKLAGALTTDYFCIDEKGNACEYPATPYEEGKKYIGPRYPLSVSKDLREKVPFIYVDVLRDYSKQDPSNRWSILRRLLTDINTSLNSDKTLVSIKTPDDIACKMTRKAAFELKIKEAYSLLKTDKFIEIEKKIRDNSLEQMGIDPTDGDVSIRFDSYDPMNVFKNLQLYVDQMGISTTADMVGAGLQSAIVIAIFRTYEEIKKEGAIFAIEEPEVFLHPQKQRYFSDILSSLSSSNQVFITTHSPTFIRIYEPEEVCLISRNKVNGTTARICEKGRIIKTEKDTLKIENYFDNQRNELFFARGVIFVEGATEKFVFPYASLKASINLNRYGISVVECGGKGNLLMFAKVAAAFNIPYVVVADDDIQDLSRITDPEKRQKLDLSNRDNEAKNRALQDFIPQDCLHWMVPNIEAVLGISENTENKVKRARDHLKPMQKEDLPSAIMRPINQMISSIDASKEDIVD